MNDADSEELDFSEDNLDEQTQIRIWAEKTRELGSITNLLSLAQKRRASGNEAWLRGLGEMQKLLGEMYRGNIGGDIWTLTLTLQQGGGDSSGTRNYVLSIGDIGITAECNGSEWVRGEGSDSWTGAEFRFSPDGNKRSGDYYSFIAEFEDAICDTGFTLQIEQNGDAVLSEAEEIESNKAVEREELGRALVSRVVRDLQSMQDEAGLLSDADTGLRDIWDEVCVQEQTERSFSWAAYELTISGLIDGLLEDYSNNQLRELWRLTEAGESWAAENPHAKTGLLNRDDIRQYLFDQVLQRAANYSNSRIRAFNDRRYLD